MSVLQRHFLSRGAGLKQRDGENRSHAPDKLAEGPGVIPVTPWGKDGPGSEGSWERRPFTSFVSTGTQAPL